jgi:metal-responsive CopG/Arc/MetJ family transcriptional regulator
MASTATGPKARNLGIPRYIRTVPKVMVSMPEDLLAEVDAEAQRTGSTRSAVLREFAEAALRRRRSDRAAAIRALLRDTADHGGETAERVKESRPQR